MLELAPTLVFALLACWGAGRIFPGGQGEKNGVGEALIGAGFSGLCGMALLAVAGGVINLFVPLEACSTWVFAALALYAVTKLAKPFRRDCSLDVLVIFALVLVFSSRGVLHGDTGNYHHQAVLWISQDALPTGLANLHGRFGFNSSWWVVGAWMEFPWLPVGASIYLLTGALCFFFGLILFGSMRNVGSGDASAILIACSAYLWFRQMAGINNPSFSTDAPANLFVVASAAALVRSLNSARKRDSSLAIWCLLAASAATFKLTAMPWFGLSGLAVAWYFLNGALDEDGRRWKSALVIPFLVGSVSIAVGAIRGVVISGYPLYPTRVLAIFDVPWKVPVEGIEGDTKGIRDWPTRGNDGGGGVVQFVWRWVENQVGFTNIIFASILVLAIGLLAFFVLRKMRFSQVRAAFLPLVPVGIAATVGLTVCFIYAPAMRFVSGYFFVVIGLFVAGVLASGNWLRISWVRKAMVTGLAVTAVLPNLRGAAMSPVSLMRLPRLPPPVVVEMTTSQGEIVRVNRGGGSWAAPLPATPYFNAGLIIRRDQTGRIVGFLPAPAELK